MDSDMKKKKSRTNVSFKIKNMQLAYSKGLKMN